MRTGSRHGAYRVVGYAVVPTIGGDDGVGTGGVLTADGLHRLQPAPDINVAAAMLVPGAPRSTLTRIAKKLQLDAGVEDKPGVIVDIARVRRIPGLLAAVLATR